MCVMLVICLSGCFKILNADVNDKKRKLIKIYVHKYFPERLQVYKTAIAVFCEWCFKSLELSEKPEILKKI